MKKKDSIPKIINILILALLILQPFMDIYLSLSDSIFQIFGLSIIEVTNILLTTVIVFFTFINNKDLIYKKKWLFIIVGCIYIAYLGAHLFNIQQFNESLFPKSDINIFKEIYYISRSYLIFLVLTACLIINKCKKENLFKALNIFILIITFIMIITNVFKVALVSYNDDNVPIAVNIFEWFTYSGDTKLITSKGLFFSANQISILLLMLFPITIYNSVKNKRVGQYIILFMHILSMIMLGTRIASLGFIGISVGFILLRLVLVLKEKKFNDSCKWIYFVFLISLPFIAFSPLIKKTLDNYYVSEPDEIILKESEIINNNIDEEEKEKIEKIYKEIKKKTPNKDVIINKNIDLNKYGDASLKLVLGKCSDIARDQDIIDYMNNNYEKHRINSYFVKAYPIEKDPEFWCERHQNSSSKNTNYRKLKTDMYERLFELNNRKLDPILGIGYTVNMLDTEADYSLQYFQFGILGVILLIGPYILCLLLGLFAVIRDIKKKFTMENVLLLVSLFCGLGAAIFNGHFFSYSIIMIPVALICSLIVNEIISSKENNYVKKGAIQGKKLSVIVPVYNVEKYLSKCLDSLVHQTLKDIEIIVVNDGSPDKSQEIIDSYVQKYPKIVKSYIKKNGGLSDARNFGLKKATAEYIAFLDSDDWIRQDAYQIMYAKACEKDFDMVVCDIKYVYEDHNKGTTSRVSEDCFSKNEIKKLYGKIYPAVWNKIFKRELFEKNNLTFKKGVWYEDVEFIYRMLPYISSIGVVHEELNYYVQRTDSISNTFDERLYDEIQNWNGIIEFYKKNNLYEEYKPELEYTYISFVCGSFIKQASNYKNKEEFNKAVEEALKNRKNHFPKYYKNKLFYQNGIKGLYLLLFNKFVANMYYLIKRK